MIVLTKLGLAFRNLASGFVIEIAVIEIVATHFSHKTFDDPYSLKHNARPVQLRHHRICQV